MCFYDLCDAKCDGLILFVFDDYENKCAFRQNFREKLVFFKSFDAISLNINQIRKHVIIDFFNLKI